MELEPDAGSARPLVSRGSITFNFPPPAALTGSHDFEALVTIMFINKNIVLLIVAEPKIGRRK